MQLGRRQEVLMWALLVREERVTECNRMEEECDLDIQVVIEHHNISFTTCVVAPGIHFLFLCLSLVVSCAESINRWLDKSSDSNNF